MKDFMLLRLDNCKCAA